MLILNLTRTGLLIAVVTAFGATAAFAQDAAKGAALLAEARRAVGGEAKLAAIKTLDVKGQFKRSAGPMTLDGELRVRLARPDKLRRDEDLSPPGGGPSISRTEVLNGNTVWEEGGGPMVFGRGRGGARRGGPDDADPGDRAPRDPAERAKEFEEVRRRALAGDLARLSLAWLLVADTPATWVGTAESPDGKADVLEIAPADAPAMRLFLDQSSHLPLMITWQGPAPMIFVRGGRRGGRGDGDQPRPQPPPAREPATLRMTLGEYKAVDGVKLPHFITRAVNGDTIEEWTIDSYRSNMSFRADVFQK
jgi:hypothetical protein